VWSCALCWIVHILDAPNGCQHGNERCPDIVTIVSVPATVQSAKDASGMRGRGGVGGAGTRSGKRGERGNQMKLLAGANKSNVKILESRLNI
jgi:hypothetical protein